MPERRFEGICQICGVAFTYGRNSKGTTCSFRCAALLLNNARAEKRLATFVFDGAVAKMPLSGGGFTLIDACEAQRFSRYVWRVLQGYAVRSLHDHLTGKSTTVHLHRELVTPPDGMWADHVNRNRLDNRRQNLRFATPSQNGGNRSHGFPRTKHLSAFKGVCPVPYGWWHATIAGRYLGRFRSEEDAAAAYDKAAVERYGEFAVLNFPERMGAA